MKTKLILLTGLFLAINGTLHAQVRATEFASGFTQPLGFVQDPSDPAVQYVVQQTGQIRVIASGVVQVDDLLDLSASISCCGERGLLGLTFPPDYATTGRLYVNFTNLDGHTVIARFKRSSSDPLVADPTSRFDLRWGGTSGVRYIVQPFTNHNGGHLVFGPDGYLYIGMGDGGSGNDPLGLAQDPESRLGKMLRIDVSVPDSDSEGFAIPVDNPFAASQLVATQPEIWAFGLRNPWRFSFDDGPGGTGALVIGDVGQARWEEITYEPSNTGGRNYGWVHREGLHPTPGIDRPPTPGAPTVLIDPIYEYDHSIGSSVTGGFVYRGSSLGPFFKGRYVFADFVSGRVWSLGLSVDPITREAAVADILEHTQELAGGRSLGNISSFGRDTDGELYLVQYDGGTIFRLEPVPAIFARPPLVGVGAAVTAQVVNGPGSISDWVGLYPRQAADVGPVADWRYLNGQHTLPAAALTDSTVTFRMPAAPGTYDVRLFSNNSLTRLGTSSAITVVNPTVMVNATSAHGGLALSATVTHGPGNTGDWLGLYPANAPNSGPLIDWTYLNGLKSVPLSGVTTSTVTFPLSPTAGSANVRLFSDNTLNLLATSVAISNAEPQLTVNAARVGMGAPVMVSVSNGPGNLGDWVGLYPVTASDRGPLMDWQYLNGAKMSPTTGFNAANLTFFMSGAGGDYHFRFFSSNGLARLATSATVTVGTPTITLNTVGNGQLTATIANGPGNVGDWVGLYPLGATNAGPIVDWQYLNGQKSVPTSGLAIATLNFRLPATAGHYHLRFFSDNSLRQLAESTTVTIMTTP